MSFHDLFWGGTRKGNWNLILKFCAVEYRFMIYFEAGREREPQTWRCRIVRWIRQPSRTVETSYFVEIKKDLFFKAFHHYNVKKILKNYMTWMVNSLTVWFVAGRGRNYRIWKWNVITNIRGKSAAGEIKDFIRENGTFPVKDFTVEPRLSEPLHNEVLGITKDFVQFSQNYTE